MLHRLDEGNKTQMSANIPEKLINMPINLMSNFVSRRIPSENNDVDASRQVQFCQLFVLFSLFQVSTTTKNYCYNVILFVKNFHRTDVR